MVRISKIYRMLLSALLAFLGFSCGRGVGIEDEGFRGEYGVPSATYKAKGVVVSALDDSPIEGIQAVLKGRRLGNAVYTDSTGFFSLQGNEFPYQVLYVELTDVDGDANGSYASMEVEADYTNVTFTGSSGNWYRGKAEIDLGTIKMQPMQPE